MGTKRIRRLVDGAIGNTSKADYSIEKHNLYLTSKGRDESVYKINIGAPSNLAVSDDTHLSFIYIPSRNMITNAEVYVIPKERGTGFGTFFFNALDSFAKAADVTEIRVRPDKKPCVWDYQGFNVHRRDYWPKSMISDVKNGDFCELRTTLKYPSHLYSRYAHLAPHDEGAELDKILEGEPIVDEKIQEEFDPKELETLLGDLYRDSSSLSCYDNQDKLPSAESALAILKKAMKISALSESKKIRRRKVA